MGLSEYKRKRDFQKTPEPAGKQHSRSEWRYVIQKHAASRLHYDFRLELDGVLKSWAVPKGPSLDPQQKRLAVHVEDHPIEYGAFEGIIPAGEYGGGTVMLWDQGHWTAVGDAAEGYRLGKLKFQLDGEKLHGGWMLVRKGGAKGAEDEKNWFLFKERDEYARPGGEDILEELPLSASSGRSMDEIAIQQDRVWGSPPKTDKIQPRLKHDLKSSATSKTKPSAKSPKPGLKAVSRGQAKSKMPDFVDPQLATLAKEAPQGDEWLHEIKFDGYRMLCRVQNGRARFLSRNEQDWTHRFDHFVRAANQLPAKEFMIDGEVVAIEPNGITSFQALQNVFSEGREGELVYQVFDLLYLNGQDVRKIPLEQRKDLLSELVPSAKSGMIRYTEHFVGSGSDVFAQACRMGLEGIIAKRKAGLISAAVATSGLK
jgi:bifunctional non-homologous end joining protein LigD